MARILRPTQTGVLLGDQRTDQVLLLRDFNGDGDSRDEGEITVFFDADNLSGIESPTTNVFNVHQASDKSVYVGDGGADAVYRLQDLNNDGDANDEGEAVVWFSDANAAGFTLPTPNGVHEGGDGAIYIVNAGTGSEPTDAVYRTEDLNGDGDAEDEGEARIWLDLQTIAPTASAFDITFVGDVAFVNDTAGGETDVIYRIEDLDGSGDISTDEVTIFASEDASFGAPIGFANASLPDGSILTITDIDTGGDLSLWKLTDLDGSGSIDAAEEAVEIWNTSVLPEGLNMIAGFSVAADEDGNIHLTGTGSVISLRDLNGDGDYLDEGESIAAAAVELEDPVDRPRALAYYEGTPETVASLVGTGNQFSLFLDAGTNTLFSTGANFFGQLGLGVEGFNIEQPQEVELPEGFDETIVSVAVGQLHSTFLTDAGDVYAFGFGNNGSLGLGDEENRSVPEKITGALDELNVVAVETGNGVSYAITDTGALYAWGFNSNGQLGLGDQDERLVPTLVEGLGLETVVAVSSGTSYTLALTADGQVYGFGANRDGQLGSPEGLDTDGTPLTRVLSPVLVAGLPSNITAITADTNTSYAVTEDGRVFGWGESRFGQLLQGTDQGDGTFIPDEADVSEPVELTALPDNVVDVKGGARWAAALTADGDVWIWGPNDEGPTGGLDGDPAFESDVTFFPVRLAALNDPEIVEIQSGPNALIARAADGRIFTLGINGDGRLGFDSDGETAFAPVEITLGGDTAPWLLSAIPADNGRDVANDAPLVLTFTEVVEAGEGVLRLVNRDSGEVTEIDVNNRLLVDIEGDTVTILPPAHLEAGARYAVEIEAGAFVDLSGQAYAGIDAGDTSSFNFTVSDIAADSEAGLKGTRLDDVIRGGAASDRLNGRDGDDIVSGGDGADRLAGGNGDDDLFGNAGADQLLGGDGRDALFGGDGADVLTGGDDRDFLSGGDGADALRGGQGRDVLEGDGGNDNLIGNDGDDRLDGGEGDDNLRGGEGLDTFVYNGGADRIRDLEATLQFDGDPDVFHEVIEIDIDGFSSFADIEEVAAQKGNHVVLTFSETDSLTLIRTDLADLSEANFDFV